MTRALGSRPGRGFVTTLTLAFAALALAAMALPASAHGDELHEEDPAVSVSDPAATPDARLPAHDMSGDMGADMMPDMPAEQPASLRVDTVLRNLHPASVHFAIALFVVAAVTQAIALRRPSRDLDAAVRVMVIAGGAGAVLAAMFGWIHTGFWLGGDATMLWHRWLGSGLALVGGAMAVAAWRRAGNPTLMTMLLFVIALAILAQSYLGGELGHGAGHMFAGH